MRIAWELLKSGAWPASAALLATVLATAFSAWSLRQPGLTPETYAHWDSGQYLSIAEHGYQLQRCGDGQHEYPPDAWCGNTGWLPAYPLAIRALMGLGMRGPAAGVAISHLALWLLYLALFAAVGAAATREDAWLALVLAAVFPGSVYYQAVFPVSLFLLAAVAALLALERDRPLLAGAAGALAAFTYSTGFLLAPVMIAALALHPGLVWRRRLSAMALAGGLTVAGFLAVLACHAVAVGRWDALFLVQEKYGHGLHNPLVTWLLAVKGAFTPAGRLFPAHVETMLAGLAMAAILGWAVWRWRRLSRRELLVVLYLAAFWLFPLIMGRGVSLTRQEALLLPAVLLAPRLPAAARGWVILALAVLDIHLTVLFFLDVLI